MEKFALAVAFLALAIALYAAFEPAGAVRPGEEAEGELAYHMAYLQRYADKLYFAGTAANRPLADFYLHEIEETAEMIVAEGPVEDGVEIGPLVEAMLLPAVERAEGAVASGERTAFADAYAGLVDACNACHQATAHGFVEVVVPERPAYTGQAYGSTP